MLQIDNQFFSRNCGKGVRMHGVYGLFVIISLYGMTMAIGADHRVDLNPFEEGWHHPAQYETNHSVTQIAVPPFKNRYAFGAGLEFRGNDLNGRPLLLAQVVAARKVSQAPTSTKNSADKAPLGSEVKSLDLPPRLQWDTNFGYCGEVSLISAGLYYGQYVSQFDMRTAANNNPRQSHRRDQILISLNDSTAAKNMHLEIINWKGEWNKKRTDDYVDEYLLWVKQNIIKGYPVTIGVLNRHCSEPTDGSNYDHIVPVNTISSRHPLSDGKLHNTDTLQFSDNYGNDSEHKHAPDTTAYQFNYLLRDFKKSRKELDRSQQEYALATDRPLFAWAVSGVKDEFRETVSVRVRTSQNYESPEINEDKDDRPGASNITLTVTVSGLQPNVEYRLYRYSNLDSVPDGRFNMNANKASKSWPIKPSSSTTFEVQERIKTSEVAVYRAVPITAR